MPPTRRYRTRRNASPPPFIASGAFPFASLPFELAVQIASYLTPRGILALIFAFPDFSDILYVFNRKYTREQRVLEDTLYRWYTPLQYFSSRGIQPVVQRLLETGADPNEMSFGDNKHQIAPLVHAIAFRSASIVELLLQHGARVDQGKYESPHIPLLVAVGPANAISPRRLRNQDSYSIRAAEIPRIVELLLGAGADVNGQIWTRQLGMRTVIQTACATVNANPVVVRSLIAAGADMERVGTLGRQRHYRWRGQTQAVYPHDTAIALIHFAANAGNTEVIQILLDAGADIEVKTRDGMKALDLAVLHRRRDVVEMLIKAGADVNAIVIDETKPGAVLDPITMVEETATWEQLQQWLHLRGVKEKSLLQWWNQGRDMALPPRRAGQGSFFKSISR